LYIISYLLSSSFFALSYMPDFTLYLLRFYAFYSVVIFYVQNIKYAIDTCFVKGNLT